MVRLMKSEKGFSLIEVIIAIAILGIIGTVFLGALATASKAMFVSDERATAESLARSQIEYVKNCKYEDLPTPSWSYELPSNPPSWDMSHALPAGYDGYSLKADGNIFDADGDGSDDIDIQKITVVIYHPYDPAYPNENIVIILEGYKVNR